MSTYRVTVQFDMDIHDEAVVVQAAQEQATALIEADPSLESPDLTDNMQIAVSLAVIRILAAGSAAVPDVGLNGVEVEAESLD